LFAAGPVFALLAGAGLVLLWRLHRALAGLAGLLLLGVAGVSIRNVDFTPKFQPNGYRELAEYLGVHASSADTMVLDGTSQWPLYWYYAQLRGGLEQKVLFLPRDTLPATEQAVRDVIAGSAAWYLEADVDRYDPHHDGERLLAADGYEAFEGHFGGQRAVYFASQPVGQLAPLSVPVGSMQLVGATLPSSSVSAGQSLGVTLQWRRSAASPAAFKVSLRLEDAGGTVVAQNDGTPWDGFFLWAGWLQNQTLDDHAGLIVPVGTLPGTYTLRALAYDTASGQALGSVLTLGSVMVDHRAPERAGASDLPILPRAVNAGGVQLVAASVATPRIGAGDQVTTTLLWTGGRTSAPANARLEVAGAVVDHVIGGDAYPSTSWPDADAVRETVDLRVPASTVPGVYAVTVGGAAIGQVQVTPSTRTFSAPPMTHVLNASFDDVVKLVGFDDSSDAAAVHLRLAWQAIGQGSTPYTVFVHDLASDGSIVGQADVPLGNEHWVSNEVNVASYDISLQQPGTVRIQVGVYDPTTGRRLPVSSGGDSLIIDTVNR
ncbi:MAG: hypothetical protein JO247_08000, partial [Chloroflexi bacterium]|nr:hypothetical protein [Chloroflexota bacterium]